MLQIYLTSQVKYELLQGIINYDIQTKILQYLYNNYGAALVGEVILRNAQRTGVVLVMRQSEVKVPIWYSNLLKITVYNHKTGKLKRQLYSYINWQGMQ